MWGAEANLALSLLSQGNVELVGLVGLRYVDLRETLHIDTSSAALNAIPNNILIQSDQFRTRNQFYGGQVGGRLNWQGERFALDLTGKLALGGTHQSIDIQGYSMQSGVTGVFPGGFLINSR